MAADVADIESQAAVLAQQLNAKSFGRLQAKLQTLSAGKMIAGIDMEQLRTAGAVNALAKLTKPKVQLGPLPPSNGAPAPKYKRLDLNVRALRCVDETNPENGTDDMVLGAVRIGASGNLGYTKAIVAGEFNDGVRRTYGELPFGTVSLTSTNYWPKTFYWIFQLVESDSDDAEVAQGVTDALAFAVSLVASAFGGAGAGAIAGTLIDVVGSFMALFFDDDMFAPYAVSIQLKSLNDFGPSGWRDEATGNISAHGGTYRIGYRLRLV